MRLVFRDSWDFWILSDDFSKISLWVDTKILEVIFMKKSLKSLFL